MKKVYMHLANGFEEIEALAVVDVLRRADIDAQMVSITGKKEVTGTHGITVVADVLIEDADYSTVDMVVLPGGLPGTANLDNCTELCNKLKDFEREGKWIAAICAAPSVLARLGILKDREATCYPGVENFMFGAKLKRDRVVQDGNVITSRGPATAIHFALKLVEVLVDAEKARSIKEGMLVE